MNITYEINKKKPISESIHKLLTLGDDYCCKQHSCLIENIVELSSEKIEN